MAGLGSVIRRNLLISRGILAPHSQQLTRRSNKERTPGLQLWNIRSPSTLHPSPKSITASPFCSQDGEPHPHRKVMPPAVSVGRSRTGDVPHTGGDSGVELPE